MSHPLETPLDDSAVLVISLVTWAKLPVNISVDGRISE